jgi:hypothetical protein
MNVSGLFIALFVTFSTRAVDSGLTGMVVVENV